MLYSIQFQFYSCSRLNTPHPQQGRLGCTLVADLQSHESDQQKVPHPTAMRNAQYHPLALLEDADLPYYTNDA